MTITFDTETNDYSLFVNGEYGFANRIEFISMYSNTVLLDMPATIYTSNARYTQLDFTIPSDFAEKHVEGIYKYIVYTDLEVLAQGVISIITEPGGDTGTDPYISNNEDREAQVFYRPQY